jgi:hypothetical protein
MDRVEVGRSRSGLTNGIPTSDFRWDVTRVTRWNFAGRWDLTGVLALFSLRSLQ